MEDYNIDELLKNIKPNLHKSYNGIFLTDEEVSVLKEEDETLRNSRLLLLASAKVVIKNATSILGIEVVEKL